jgi:hypothetical protein
LLIVCVFGVVLGGLNLTAVYRPSFYLVRACRRSYRSSWRVALEGDQVHLYIGAGDDGGAGLILAFGHQLNDVLTRSLAMRYENIDLIEELKGKSRRRP